MHRRQFLRCAAIAATPTVLAGCGVAMPTVSYQPQPEDALLGRFAVDSRALARILSALGQNGADFGEVYFQRQRARRVRAVDGQLLSARNGQTQGAGLRVVRSGATGFAVSESFDDTSLQAAAQAAAG